MCYSLQFYHGFLLALREKTDRFPTTGRKFHQAVKSMADKSAEYDTIPTLEAAIDPVFGSCDQAGQLVIEGMLSLLIETDMTRAYFKSSKEKATKELDQKEGAEEYRQLADHFIEQFEE